ncbi:MAG: hypothetical protein PHG31_01690 [Candidatus Omnitrophica bacterium]|nr:hypothetical protein [Candidatus Omnitrophota bacterium]
MEFLIGDNTLVFLLNWFVFLLYSSICIISLIFTFSIKTYQRIDDYLSSELISLPMLTALDKSIEALDLWFMSHNRIVGPILVLLSVVDLKLYFNVINKPLF